MHIFLCDSVPLTGLPIYCWRKYCSGRIKTDLFSSVIQGLSLYLIKHFIYGIRFK